MSEKKAGGADKQQRYLEITKQIVGLVGGRENIVASTHCATRLRIVLKDYDKVDREKLEDVDLVKGQFIAGQPAADHLRRGPGERDLRGVQPVYRHRRQFPWPRSRPRPPRR